MLRGHRSPSSVVGARDRGANCVAVSLLGPDGATDDEDDAVDLAFGTADSTCCDSSGSAGSASSASASGARGGNFVVSSR